jgi:DNA polymerase V
MAQPIDHAAGGRAAPGADRYDAAWRVGEGGEGTGTPTQAQGFPSPAQDYFHGGLDLNRLLVRDRASTFIMRVDGDSMAPGGMAHGDEIIVDRALTPRDRSVVVVILDGELALRRWFQRDHGGRTQVLLATDDRTKSTLVTEETDMIVWGVVTRCLHHV